MKNNDVLDEMLNFLDRLDKTQTYYTLSYHRSRMIMINIVVPGERWEIEFEDDGDVHVERFISDGVKGRESLDLFTNQYLDTDSS